MTSVVLEEIPDRVSLAVEISNCQGSCVGCHSPFLRDDIGSELTPALIDSLIADNFGVDCFLFLGEGKDAAALLALAGHIRKTHPSLALALYSGREQVETEIWEAFDYVKVGPYLPECGPLNERSTNQRLYRLSHGTDGMPDAAPGHPRRAKGRAVSHKGNPIPALPGRKSASGIPANAEDITARFWRKGIEGIQK